MKKFIAIFAIIATFGFVACNNAAETTEEATDSTQVEFFNGELSGSFIQVEDGELNPLNFSRFLPTQRAPCPARINASGCGSTCITLPIPC